MRWREGRRSTNVEDRRGRRVGRGGLKIGGGLGLLILLAVLLLGGDPVQFLGALLGSGTAGGPGGAAPAGQVGSRTAAEDEPADFTTRVLAMTEDTWTAIFAESGRTYNPPTLVMFTDRVQSACGLETGDVDACDTFAQRGYR